MDVGYVGLGGRDEKWGVGIGWGPGKQFMKVQGSDFGGLVGRFKTGSKRVLRAILMGVF